MSLQDEYKRFAASSLDSTEKVTELSAKACCLIVAKAWLDLAEQTAQLTDHEAYEAHLLIEPPLKRATV